jgi:predicted RNase H-like HicB family nuclease
MSQAKSQVKSQPNSYAYVVERADDGSYWAYLPDLPGCATAGDSPEEVERQLPEAVALYLSYYHDRGHPPPPPQARVGTLTAA